MPKRITRTPMQQGAFDALKTIYDRLVRTPSTECCFVIAASFREAGEGQRTGICFGDQGEIAVLAEIIKGQLPK